jgi:hypothetical protein
MKNNNEKSYLVFQVNGYSAAITDAGKIGITNFYQRNGLSISVPYTILGTTSTLDDATLIINNNINTDMLKAQAVQSDEVRRIEEIYDTESKILESATECKFREDNPLMESLITDYLKHDNEMDLYINSLANGSN